MNRIAPDKWKHFFVGIAMGIFLEIPAYIFIPAHLVAATITVLFLIILISYGFELFSKFTGLGYYEVMDAVASTLGGSLGVGIILLIRWLNAR